MNLEELVEKVKQWSIDKGIDKALPEKQMLKLIEEIGELASGLAKDNKEVIIDSLGDVLVVLIILHQQLGYDIYDTLYVAYDEIKDRKGETKNGVFVKESDL